MHFTLKLLKTDFLKWLYFNLGSWECCSNCCVREIYMSIESTWSEPQWHHVICSSSALQCIRGLATGSGCKFACTESTCIKTRCSTPRAPSCTLEAGDNARFLARNLLQNKKNQYVITSVCSSSTNGQYNSCAWNSRISEKAKIKQRNTWINSKNEPQSASSQLQH